jgi:hypothetical protein
MKNTPTALQGALAFDILTRLTQAIGWEGSYGEATIHQTHLATLNEAFALCGGEPLFVDTKALDEDEAIDGFSRGDFSSKDAYAEHVDSGLNEQFHALCERVSLDRAAHANPAQAEVYVNVEITVPRSRLNCEDLQIAGTYKVLVPGSSDSAEQAAIALAVFHSKVGLKDPAHFNLQVIQVLEADPALAPVNASSLGEYKGAFSFHPSLEPVARKA